MFPGLHSRENMASTWFTVGGQIASIIGGVAGAPAFVELRKTFVIHPLVQGIGDPDQGVIVSGGTEKTLGYSFEGSTANAYGYVVSIYDRTTPVVDATDTRPTFLELVKEALSVTTIAGTPIWDFEIADKTEWENQPFKQGGEISQFGLLYRTSEPTNG